MKVPFEAMTLICSTHVWAKVETARRSTKSARTGMMFSVMLKFRPIKLGREKRIPAISELISLMLEAVFVCCK